MGHLYSRQQVSQHGIKNVPTKEGHIHGSTVHKLLIRGHLLTRTNFIVTRMYSCRELDLSLPTQTSFNVLAYQRIKQDHAIVLLQWNTACLKRDAKVTVSPSCLMYIAKQASRLLREYRHL